jgi:hypothetical protein
LPICTPRFVPRGVRYDDSYRLYYVRGPGDIIVELAELLR